VTYIKTIFKCKNTKQFQKYKLITASKKNF